MNYLKQNHLSILIILFLVISPFFGTEVRKEVPQGFGVAANVTTVSNPWEFSGAVTNSSTISNTGTTTIARSYDGFMAGGGITPASVATGTVHTLYTHTGGRSLCNTAGSGLYADSTGYSPNLVISVGTSTSAAYSTNLIASSTLATTTDEMLPSSSYLFVMEAGDEITAFLADGITNASSTNFANWDIEYQTQCWLIGG